jgi:hypothetical protein
LADTDERNPLDAQVEKPEAIATKQKETSADKAARRTATATIWMAVFTCLLLVVTGGTLLILRSQLNEMHAGGIDTHDLAVAAGRQAVAAKSQSETAQTTLDSIKANGTETKSQIDRLIAEQAKTATAMRDAVTQARKSMESSELQSTHSLEVSERAWVGDTGVDVTGDIAVGQQPFAQLVMLNSGKTPAIHTEVRFRMQIFCGTFPVSPEYDPLGSPSTFMLVPGIPRRAGMTHFVTPLTSGQMEQINRPGCNLYIYGKILYRDIFEHSHWKHTCSYWAKGTPNTILSCSVYTDGDEDYSDGKEPN